VTTALAAIAATWGVVMALGPLLQIRRMHAFRSSQEISIGYLAVLLVGFVLWVAYGASARNLAIVVPNGVAFVVGAAAISVAVSYRR